MSTSNGNAVARSILLVGASRGLGLALAGELAERGWHVVATERSHTPELRALADRHGGRVAVETLDIADPDQIAALHDRLSDRTFDALFVNAGTTNHNQDETIGEVSTDEFVRVMLINALGVMRAVEGLDNLVASDGLIGVMSSGQGSITNNERGGREVYRGSKAALNQYLRSYAARHSDSDRAMLLLAPGWIRTELGGSEAPFTVEESTPKLVDVIVGQLGKPGLRYLDRDGKVVPW